MVLFTFLFLVLLKREWGVYVSLRHDWLSRHRVETHAVLLRAIESEGAMREVEVRLGTSTVDCYCRVLGSFRLLP